MENIEIVEYSERYNNQFKTMNLEWIEKFFVVEPADEYILSNPQEAIVDKGGHIYFAKCGAEIVGTFALLKVDNHTFEIAKMAVNEKYQGLGIGKILMDIAIQKTRELNLHRLVLYSSTKLTTALGMYTKFGFQVVPLDDHPTSRANIKMELVINNKPAIEKVHIKEKLNLINDHWKPRIVGELNNQQVRIVKLKGEFVPHVHENEDEFFLVIKGVLTMEYDDQLTELTEGEFIIIPKGTKHRPIADEEVHLLLFEPATILNTGNIKNELTLEFPERI